MSAKVVSQEPYCQLGSILGKEISRWNWSINAVQWIGPRPEGSPTWVMWRLNGGQSNKKEGFVKTQVYKSRGFSPCFSTNLELILDILENQYTADFHFRKSITALSKLFGNTSCCVSSCWVVLLWHKWSQQELRFRSDLHTGSVLPRSCCL